MSRTVCIVSPGNLASNPRVLKEADALHGAGYAVTAVVSDYSEALRGEDDAIAASVPWKVVRVKRVADEGVTARAATMLAKVLLSIGMPVPANVAAYSARAPVMPLTRAARQIRADLYIAHYIAALPAAAAAAQRHGALLGFDAEDFHSGEGTGAPGEAFRMKMVETVEGALLPSCTYMTAASPLIGEAYARRYEAHSFNVAFFVRAPRRDPLLRLTEVMTWTERELRQRHLEHEAAAFSFCALDPVATRPDDLFLGANWLQPFSTRFHTLIDLAETEGGR